MYVPLTVHSFEVTYEIWRSAHTFSYYYFSLNAEFAFRWALSIRISKVMAVYVSSFRHVMRTKLTSHIRSTEQYSIFGIGTADWTRINHNQLSQHGCTPKNL